MATWYIAASLGCPPPGRTETALTTLLPDHDPNFLEAIITLRRPDRWAPILRFVHPVTHSSAYYEETSIDRSPAEHQIILLRDPRDIVVSYFHHIIDFRKGKLKDRSGKIRNLSLETSLTEFVYSPTMGIRKVVSFMRNVVDWAMENNASIFYFEDFIADATTTLRQFLQECGIDNPQEHLVVGAVDACRFEKMQTAERAVSSRGPNQRRVRKGMVGNYLSELPEREVDFVNRVLRSAAVRALERYG